ncbi:sulfite exporter TauE/SafE family protein [Eisenibacter elegans]|uniref:sulfite exporter TauE/SafE family protein n=1 Tax=Eisenibacter elegans TaxID=997 RepID=UPI00047D0B27|nr:sulfite exporter TauE/SafE family protein [Eisenibacter elegans]
MFTTFLIALLTGLVMGLLGGGGSILTIPLFVYVFQVTPILATAYSLFVVGVSAWVGVFDYARKHLVRLRQGYWVAIPSIFSVVFTRNYLLPALPERLHFGALNLSRGGLLMTLFAGLMFYAAYWMFRPEDTPAPASKPWRLAMGGLGLGWLTGMVGAGGGFLIVPMLMGIAALPVQQAVGTSLFIIGINALTGLLGDLWRYHLDWPFLLSFTTAMIVGVLLGGQIARQLPAKALRRMFGVFIILMALYILWREWRVFS